jgi:hypothetical protein
MDRTGNAQHRLIGQRFPRRGPTSNLKVSTQRVMLLDTLARGHPPQQQSATNRPYPNRTQDTVDEGDEEH